MPLHPRHALLALLLLGACRGDPTQVLYLRQAQPPSGSSFQRVSPSAVDLGSLSTTAPVSGEDRSCGSVVAFGARPGLFPPGELHVHEVLYRLWWYSGSYRGTLALNAPDLPTGFAELPLAACDLTPDDPQMEDGYVFTTARVPVDLTLSAAQLDGLYLTLDVAGASVKVATCPSRTSMVVLNPPSDQELRGHDRDRDGVDDGQELLGTRRDPFRADPQEGEGCLPPTQSIRPPALEAPGPVPAVQQRLEIDSVQGSQTWRDQVFGHQGHLEVVGALEISGATLVLEAGDDGTPATLAVLAGGALTIESSRLVAPDPTLGFHIWVEQGASLSITDSRVEHGGFIRLGEDGQIMPYTAALSVWADDVVIRGNHFLHDVVALEIGGHDAQVESNHFIANGTAILASGKRGQVRHNDSQGDGLFLFLDAYSSDWVVEQNLVQWSMDMGVRVSATSSGNLLQRNQFIDGNMGVQLDPSSSGQRLLDNTLRTCRQPLGSGPHLATRHTIVGNRLAYANSPVCPPNPGLRLPLLPQ